MTLAQQIQTLQGRGLMIADTNKAEQAVNQRRFQTNLETIKKEVGRSKERYIREHFRKYSDPDLPPVWKTLLRIRDLTTSLFLPNLHSA